MKRSADPVGGQKWELNHFTTMSFARGDPINTQDSVACRGIETGPIDASHGHIQLRPLRSSVGEIRSKDV